MAGPRASFCSQENWSSEFFQTFAAKAIPLIQKFEDYTTECWGAAGSTWKFHSSGCGGDVAFGKVVRMLLGLSKSWYQTIHQDWNVDLCTMRYGYGLVISLAVHDITFDMGAMRILPWSNRANHKLQSVSEETQWSLHHRATLRAGQLFIRDCRCLHGGTPNETDVDRYLPSLQVWPGRTIAAGWVPSGLPASTHSALPDALRPWILEDSQAEK